MVVLERDAAGGRDPASLLPDEFLAMRRWPMQAVLDLVGRYWGEHPEQDRYVLAMELIEVLDTLETVEGVTDVHRQRCREVVDGWLSRS